MFQYPGSTGSYPVNIGIMDDSDTPNFTNLAVGMEGLADRTAWGKFRFVNGVDGGTYSPSTPITVSGSGIVVDTTLVQATGSQLLLYGTEYVFGTVAVTGSGTFSSPGGSIIYTDSGEPVFQTARSATVIQPLLTMANTTQGNGDVFDTPGGGNFQYPLTRLINGATLADVVLIANSGANTATNGVVELHRMAIAQASGGLATAVDTVLGSISGGVITLNSIAQISFKNNGSYAGTEVIDTAHNHYYVKIVPPSGTGATSTTWYPCLAFLSNVTNQPWRP